MENSFAVGSNWVYDSTAFSALERSWRHLMRLIQFLASTVLIILVAPITAEDKKPEKPKKAALAGTYTRDTGELKLSFTFKKKDMLTFKLSNAGGDGMTFNAKYTMDEKGKVTMTIGKAKQLGQFEGTPPAEGAEYTFTVKQGKGTFTLGDLEGEGVDRAKEIVEGEYKLADD